MAAATPPQRDQATAAAPGASVWVSASAGSGKTKVLADRVLRLLLGGTSPERILCLTFTRAAAAEMQNRIRDLLGRWAAAADDVLAADLRALVGAEPDDGLPERARRLFAEVLEAPGGLNVLTIHAFCQSLLGRFPREAGIAPDFEVMDERATAEALTTARDSVLALGWSETGTELADALEAVTVLVGEDEFATLLHHIAYARSRIGRLGDAAGERVREALGVAAGETVDGLLDGFRHRNDGTGMRAAARALVTGSGADRKKAVAIIKWLEGDAGFESYAAVFLTREGGKRKKMATAAACKELPELEKILDDEADAVIEVAERCRAVRTAVATGAILVIARALIAHYDRHKRRRALLDYDDLILQARMLVERAAPWVMFKLDGGIDHVLIDEAQDSNADQWAIVRAVSDEFFSGEGARTTRRTVFAVGDEKQSIFGFQGAAPAEFANMKGFFGRRVGEAGLDWREVPLNTSFRSTPAVLGAVDAVFAKAREGVSSVPVRHVSRRGGQAGLVELWPPVMPPPREDKKPWDFQAGDPLPAPADRLAGAIAERISSWISGGETLESRGRAVRAGDVMILVRRRTPVVEFLAKALKEENIAVAGADRMVVSEQLAVQDLVALAAFALLPGDDLNLAAVLKGPLAGFDEERLFEVCHGRRGRLWQALRDDDAAGDVVDMLTGLLNRADRKPPFEFFTHILGPLEGRARIVARLGEQANDAIDELLALALAYERAHVPSLQGFLHWFEQGRAEIKRDLDQGVRDEVRILTVHGAKGLEAPIVFLADTMQTPQPDRGFLWDDDDRLMLWPPRADDRPAPALRLVDRARQLQDEEYRRLLYVAMTRAEDRLYVCGYGTRKSPPANCWYNLASAGLEGIAEPFDFRAGGTDGWSGPGLRLANPQEADADRPEDGPGVSGPAGDLPGWARAAAPPEPEPARPLTPAPRYGPAIRSPLGDDRGASFRRGILIHRLLQFLPDLAPEARPDAARRFLERPVHGLDGEEIGGLLAETFAVLDNPDWAPLFGPGSRAEVPVTGVVGGVAVSGRIDRLVVESQRVRILDFKTNRPPPERLSDVPAAYLRQMAAYRGLIAQMFDSIEVECCLLWTDGPRLMVLEDRILDAAGS